MEHLEWQSDAPAPDEASQQWVAPNWMVYSVFAAVGCYLIAGVAVATYDAATSTQAPGGMAVLSFILEIFIWPLKLLLPLVQ